MSEKRSPQETRAFLAERLRVQAREEGRKITHEQSERGALAILNRADKAKER